MSEVIQPSQMAGPTVRALHVLWEEVARRPLWASPNFWRYLKLRWRSRLNLLKPDRVKVLAPAGKINDCVGCTDLCCVGPRSTVLLRLVDIATLMDLGREDLMTFQKPSFSEEERADRPALRRHLATQVWDDFPIVRQNKMGACAALTTGGQCDLYPDWPLSCARFPYSLRTGPLEVFYSRRCDSFWVRSDGRGKARAMVVAAVASYNERIKDAVLLAYAPMRLEALGLLNWVRGRKG